MRKIYFLIFWLIITGNKLNASLVALIKTANHSTLSSPWNRKASILSEDIYLKHFDFKNLSPFVKKIFDDFVEDELPNGSTIKETLNEKAGTRDKIRLAQALLLRDNKGDPERAVEIIKWILSLQNPDETSIDFGGWKGSVNSNSYDQNWREFVGTDLVIIYHKYKTRLPSDVVTELERCLIRTAKGDLIRNVNPDYNNISIMSSFLLEYIGTAFNIPEIRNAGIQKAKEIYSNFLKYNTLCEYNSPTYYGVDFFDLALWRELSFSQELKVLGKILEKALWLDLSEFYNANLQNICGPYLRSYGMDMKKYNAITGVWIAAAVDNPEIATVPGKSGVTYEYSMIVSILNLGISMPLQALSRLKEFDGPKFISRVTSNYYEGDRLKKVTATIKKDWMMGGLWGNRKVSHILKTGTIHWKSPDGDISWLFIPGEGVTNVRVDEKQMKIYLADPQAKTFSILVYSKNISPENFTYDLWKFLPMQLGIQSELHRAAAEIVPQEEIDNEGIGTKDYPNIMKVVYKIPANWNPADPLLIINPNYNSL